MTGGVLSHVAVDAAETARPSEHAIAEGSLGAEDALKGVEWYKRGPIYQVQVRSFADSNADGIGDIPGMTSKLDYLKDVVGVKSIWVSPINKSPLRDGGFDVSDFTAINEQFGTVDDVKHFVEEAHKRDIRVFMEFPLNHTSDEHAWFQRARQAPKGSPEREMYVWSDDPNKWPDAPVNFKTIGETSNWEWDDVAQQYYWHRWYKFQPDLNWESPLVHQEMRKVLDFWYGEMGVDGLRLDAAPYLIEKEGTTGESLPETHKVIQDLRRYVDDKYGHEKIFLPEANRYPHELLEYFGTADTRESQMAYHFPLMQAMYEGLATGSAQPIIKVNRATDGIPTAAQWATFVRNHDELTLSLIPEPERLPLIKHYAPEPEMEVLGGVRRRFTPLMDGDPRKIDFMNASLFAKPGTPILYYGDEIGMGDNVLLWDRDGVRTPMQWTGDERTAGFSEADPSEYFLPVVDHPEYRPARVNVEAQLRDPNSQLSRTSRMVQVYNQHPALSAGSHDLIETGNDAVYAGIRAHGDDAVLVLENWSNSPQTVRIERAQVGDRAWKQFFGSDDLAAAEDGSGTITLQPHGFHWLSPVT